MYFKEVCDILNIPASSPQRGFVSHRWLSAYDASMATQNMMPAYKVLYYGFMNAEDQLLYKEPLELLFAQYKVNQRARDRIKAIHDDLCRKGKHDVLIDYLGGDCCP